MPKVHHREEEMIHQIKIEDSYFAQILALEKKFEVRYNDRGYQKGDILVFCDQYGIERFNSGMWKIIYVHSGLGMKDMFVVLGIEPEKP